MKRSTILMSLIAGAMMASCAKDAEVAPFSPNQDQDLKGAYLSLSITAPSTRGDLPDADGSVAESSVSSVKLLIFDKDYNYIGMGERTESVSPLVYDFEVAPNAFRFFAIVNSSASVDAALSNLSGNWNTVSLALQSVLKLDERSGLDEYITDNAFVMVNAGSYADNKETVLAMPSEASLVNGKLSIDKNNPTPVSIRVDRLVAKFTASKGASFTVTDEREASGSAPYGEIEGVRLNVVNRMSYIYSHIKVVTNDNGDDYRGDPNMSVAAEAAKPQGESTGLLDNFFWLHNYESPAFFAPGAGYNEYVFENTATGEFYNYNNLTQLVVKATYVPTGRDDLGGGGGGFTTVLDHKTGDDKSWFAINIDSYGTMQMTFEGVVRYYSYNKMGAPGFVTDPAICDKMDIQLRHMLAFAPSFAGVDVSAICWDSPEVTCAVLNSIPNGGYVAATVDKEENYIVQFYQNGLNYYDIFIKHDHPNVGVGLLGRWGMVRNNSYDLSINSISGPGLPYIPDPTDPEIKDPQNPDPEDPEPADKDMAHIRATITVNPWTMWTQDVDLD